MALNPDFVGRVYGPGEPYEVSRVKIADFADAIGEPSELCRDAEAAGRPGTRMSSPRPPSRWC